MGYLQAALAIFLVWTLSGVVTYIVVQPLVVEQDEAQTLTFRLLKWSVLADHDNADYGILTLPIGFIMQFLDVLRSSDIFGNLIAWIDPFNSNCIISQNRSLVNISSQAHPIMANQCSHYL